MKLLHYPAKLLLSLLFFVISNNSTSQYLYTLEISEKEQPKMKLEKISDAMGFYNRLMESDHYKIFSKNNYSQAQVKHITDSLGYELISFEKTTRITQDSNPVGNDHNKACCNIDIDMFDSFGDGWNGGQLTITIDGTSTNYAATGTGSSASVAYCDGEILDITYTSGSWEGENSYTISTPAGTLVSDGPNPSTGSIFYSDNACSSTTSMPRPQDCEGAILVCSNNTFNGTAIDYGDEFEITAGNSDCDMVDENQSTWFYVNIGTSGTLEMTIDPTNGTDDYDWSIWGPFTSATAAANCPPITAPIRCNTSANTPQTGMSTAGTNNYEFPGFSTNEWSNPINTTAGDIYIMMIDNWSASGSPFTLDWGGTAGLSCSSVVLPITLMDFNGVNLEDKNKLYWSTQSEKNNSHFTVEYSAIGVDWELIDIIQGAGTTSDKHDYSIYHRDYENGINYYRLSQFDYDGNSTKYKVISVDNSKNKKLLQRVNIMGQQVNDTYNGLVILYYNDGSIKKIIQ